MTNATLHAAPPLAVKSDWDVVCETGRLAADEGDRARWILGDLALLVEKAYGEDKIGEFARECNVPKKRIQEYRQVCGFWEKSVWTDLWEVPTVTYSHMRLAMRLGQLDEARRFVERTASKGYTVDKAGVIMGKLLGLAGKREQRPKKLVDIETKWHDAAAAIADWFMLHERVRPELVRIVMYKVQT